MAQAAPGRRSPHLPSPAQAPELGESSCAGGRGGLEVAGVQGEDQAEQGQVDQAAERRPPEQVGPGPLGREGVDEPSEWREDRCRDRRPLAGRSLGAGRRPRDLPPGPGGRGGRPSRVRHSLADRDAPGRTGRQGGCFRVSRCGVPARVREPGDRRRRPRALRRKPKHASSVGSSCLPPCPQCVAHASRPRRVVARPVACCPLQSRGREGELSGRERPSQQSGARSGRLRATYRPASTSTRPPSRHRPRVT